jgi:hypothetical protein
MTAIEYLDRPPVGWFALDVMKAGSGRQWDWCALMIDVHPDEARGFAPPAFAGAGLPATEQRP